MKKTIATLIGLSVLSLPALAMGGSAVEVDTNGDGLMSLEEVQAVYPEVTAESFAALDANADGALDDAEMVAGQEAGVIPMPKDG